MEINGNRDAEIPPKSKSCLKMGTEVPKSTYMCYPALKIPFESRNFLRTTREQHKSPNAAVSFVGSISYCLQKGCLDRRGRDLQ